MTEVKKKLDMNLDFSELEGETLLKEKGKKAAKALTKAENTPPPASLETVSTDTIEEAKAGIDKLIVEPKVETKKSTEGIMTESATFIPVAKESGGFTMKSLEETSGVEFITWVLSVIPVDKEKIPKPEGYDGKSGLEKRKATFAHVAKKHETVFKLAHPKIDITKIIH